MEFHTIPLFFYSLFSILTTSKALDTITKTQFVTVDSNTTIVSPSESFEMGFFQPGNSNNRYLGIWYKKISTGTVVWVANRENPLPNSFGVLKLIDPGMLVLLNSTNNTVWSTKTSRSTRNAIARLLDSGNLIIQDPNDHNPENFLWQSFDYPCDSREGSGCLLWFGDLIDIKKNFTENGQDLYIKMPSSELGTMRDIFKQGGNNESQKKDLEGGFGTVYKIQSDAPYFIGQSTSTLSMELLRDFFIFIKIQD